MAAEYGRDQSEAPASKAAMVSALARLQSLDKPSRPITLVELQHPSGRVPTILKRGVQMPLQLYDYLQKQALNPEWEKVGKVHDWRNYASEEIQRLWPTFNDEQKFAIVDMLDGLAGQEHWD